MHDEIRKRDLFVLNHNFVKPHMINASEVKNSQLFLRKMKKVSKHIKLEKI